MLIFLTIKNFRSIVELDMPLTYGEAKAPNGYHGWNTFPFLEMASSRAVPVLGLFGANASGKSTVIQALGILQQLLDGHEPGLFMPNRLHHAISGTTLSIKGVLPDIGIFEYSINYDDVEIHSETLVCGGRTVFAQTGGDVRMDGLRKKYYEKERLQDIYRVECLDRSGRHKKCILSCMAINYAGLNPAVSAVFQTLKEDIEVFESNSFSCRTGLKMLMSALGTESDAKGAFAEIETLLRKLDLGIRRMEFHPEYADGGDGLAEAIRTYHDDESGREVQFSFGDESMGTRTAFGLLGVSLAALHTGRTLFIDEIDSSLHSLLVEEVIRLFKDRRYNTSNAQLVFSAHNTDLLDHELLRVSEVGIINKNKISGSTLKRLSDFEGIRNVTNFRKQYLEGRFSGIPFPYL